MRNELGPPNDTPHNRGQAQQAHAALDELLAQVLRSGFHGKATIEAVVHDGAIQQCRQVWERTLR
jgi:hypothetical protein